MGSSSDDDALESELVEELLDVGNRLLVLPSTIDDLLVLLEKAESILSTVSQTSPMPTKRALVPLMTALIMDELFRNNDANIQVAVASCFNELTRISAPVFTFRDFHMKEFFQLSMTALKHLSSESGINYSRALNILESMAIVKSCLILLDIDCDELIADMFQLFLSTTGNNHSSDTFKYMEMIMTMMIEESDELSFELLRPILDSVKMDNKNISPISWELGNNIFKNCSAKLHCHLKEAVKSMNLNFDDYAEIVSAVYHDASNKKNMVEKDVGLTDGVSVLEEHSHAEKENCTPHIENDGGNMSDGAHSLETSKPRHVKGMNGESDVANEVVDIVKAVLPQGEIGFVRRRCRKPSLQKPEEGYELPWETRHKDSYGSVCEGNHRRRGRKKKKEVVADQHENLDSSNDVNMGQRRSDLRYGEDLINLKIQVWWPKDKTYYPGIIKSFDQITKKHEVLYDDGETEILNMDKEIWEPVDEKQCLSQEEVDPPAPAKEPRKTQKKTGKKRKLDSSKKQKASSTPKRSKGKCSNGFNSGVYSKDKSCDMKYDLNAPPSEDDEDNTDRNTDD